LLYARHCTIDGTTNAVANQAVNASMMKHLVKTCKTRYNQGALRGYWPSSGIAWRTGGVML